MRAPIADCKPNALDDGPGIRCVVFFKGCPLDCVWCHNPEMKRAQPELVFEAAACAGSRRCLAVCPAAALDPARPGFVDRGRCTRCFRCAEVCPSQALRRVGRLWELEAVLAEIERYRAFYVNSGGGVTLSGGEATLYLNFAAALAQALQARGLHVLLETCGYFDGARFAARLAPYLDEVYFDLKLWDSDAHTRYCGRPNARILGNFLRLLALSRAGGPALLPRLPLIPGITATAANLAAWADFLRAQQVTRVALLPYNPLWPAKAAALGRPIPDAPPGWQSAGELEFCRSFFADFELAG